MKKLFLLPVCISILLFSCKPKKEDSSADQLKSRVVENYANIVYLNYKDAYNAGINLQTAVNDFVADPTSSKFGNLKSLWLEARERYGTTEAFRFYDGPIDEEENGVEGLLNAWPLDEAYIDYVDGNAESGIINDSIDYPTISEDLILVNNEKGGEKNISAGYHAIEFLIWGQDLTAPSAKEDGSRPYTDFVDGGTAKNQHRRRLYLKATTDLLVKNLKYLVDSWEPTASYRKSFVANPTASFKNIITGIATLSSSELPGERMTVAYENQDQEDDHSCFSDNTHRDIRLNMIGISNVITGTYNSKSDGTIIGSSIQEWLLSTNPQLSSQVSTALQDAMTKTEVTAVPFDFAISDETERPKVKAAIEAIENLGSLLTAIEGNL